MEVVNKGVDLSVHDHEFNLGHLLASIGGLEVLIEKGLEDSGDHCELVLVQRIQRLLVLALEALFLSHQQIWQADHVHCQ